MPPSVPAHPGKTQLPPALLDQFERRDLPKGYLLSTPDNPSNQVFLVQSGRLRVYLAGENRELILSFLEDGDLFSTHTPTYVETVAPTVLGVMETGVFARKVAQDPSVTPVMMRVLGRILTNAVVLIEDLAFREVPVRLARFLLGMADRRGQVKDDGILVPLDLTLEDIASLLGSTRQTVSTLISQWEREGVLLRVNRRSLRIVSRQALAERCSPKS